MRRRNRSLNYGDLRRLIQCSLEACPDFGSGAGVDGKIHRLGSGLTHDNYWFFLAGPAARDKQLVQAYVLRILQRSREVARLVRESKTLVALQQAGFSWPVPEFICLVHDDDSRPVGMIESALPGIDMNSPQFKCVDTLSMIGRAAADIHRLPVEAFSHIPPVRDRCQHALDWLSTLPPQLFTTFSVAADARLWVESHLPPPEHICLLHGDLLPQNFIYDWERLTTGDAKPAGLVDWEMAALGDPAYDLAIVSRGCRKVAGVRGGLRVLVEAYRKSSGADLSVANVRVYEILLVLHWLREAWDDSRSSLSHGHGPEFYEQRLQSLLRRSKSL